MQRPDRVGDKIRDSLMEIDPEACYPATSEGLFVVFERRLGPNPSIIHSYAAHWTALTTKALILQIGSPRKKTRSPPSL